MLRRRTCICRGCEGRGINYLAGPGCPGCFHFFSAYQRAVQTAHLFVPTNQGSTEKIKFKIELNFFQHGYFTNQTLPFPMAPFPTTTFRVRRHPTTRPYDLLTQVGLFFGVFVGVIFLSEIVLGNGMIALILLPASMFYIVYKTEDPPMEVEITVDEIGLTALITKSAMIHEEGVSTFYKWAEIKCYHEAGTARNGLRIIWYDEPDSFFYDKEWKRLLQYLRTNFPEKESITLQKNNYP